MYSRRTYGGQFRIPEHYSGTAFRNPAEINHNDERRDAVGRPSALPEKASDLAPKEHPLPTRKKAPPPLLPKHTEEAEESNEANRDSKEIAETQEKKESTPNDDVIISALLLSLISSREDKSEDITLLILALLLIL